MLKKINLAIAATLILGGCLNIAVDNTDDEYAKILTQVPKWSEQNTDHSSTLFLILLLIKNHHLFA